MEWLFHCSLQDPGESMTRPRPGWEPAAVQRYPVCKHDHATSPKLRWSRCWTSTMLWWWVVLKGLLQVFLAHGRASNGSTDSL